MTLSNLTIRNGYVYAFSGNGAGGGIYNAGTLTLTKSTVSGNGEMPHVASALCLWAARH